MRSIRLAAVTATGLAMFVIGVIAMAAAPAAQLANRAAVPTRSPSAGTGHFAPDWGAAIFALATAGLIAFAMAVWLARRPRSASVSQDVHRRWENDSNVGP